MLAPMAVSGTNPSQFSVTRILTAVQLQVEEVGPSVPAMIHIHPCADWVFQPYTIRPSIIPAIPAA